MDTRRWMEPGAVVAQAAGDDPSLGVVLAAVVVVILVAAATPAVVARVGRRKLHLTQEASYLPSVLQVVTPALLRSRRIGRS